MNGLLRALIFALPAAVALVGVSAADRPSPEKLVLQDSQPFSQGSYSAYASPWSTFFDKSLVRGRDYSDSITINRATFPNATIIDTRWPLTKPDKSGVWGYHSVAYGNYDDNHPPVAVRSLRVKQIRQLLEYVDFGYQGSSNFNLLNEFYLTSKPGDASAKVIEIGLFLHAPPVSMHFIKKGTPITRFIDSAKRIWIITRTRNYVTIVREDGGDFARGKIDILYVLNLLRKKRVITGEEWFNGIAFGTEPTEGAGSTRIFVKHWRVHYR